jgi:nicotinamidase-related amidase
MNVIPALPYTYELPDSPNNIALLVIGMQRDLMEPGGFASSLGNDVSSVQAIVPVVKQVLETFRSLHLPVFFIVEGHKSDLSDCPPSKLRRSRGIVNIGDSTPMGRVLVLGEPGTSVIPALEPLPGETILAKPGKGAFFSSGLDELLPQQHITHLIMTGITTEVGIQTTMREANDRGYECLLVEDATESYFPEFKQVCLEMIRAQGGIVGWTATSNDVIQSLEAWKG